MTNTEERVNGTRKGDHQELAVNREILLHLRHHNSLPQYHYTMNVRSLSRALSHVGMAWLGVAVYLCRRTDARPQSVVRLLAYQTLIGSALSMLLYGLDKLFAKYGTRNRIPESTLHLVSLVGGWPGAALSQQWFRHKCRKETFLRVFVATVVINCILVVLLLNEWG